MHVVMWVSYIFLICLLVALFLTIFAALTDIRSLKIPNWISVSILALYPIAVLTSPSDIDWLYSLLVGGVALVVGFGLFAAGLFGGGDVKLITALSVWAGVKVVLPFLFLVAISGGVLVVVMLIYRYIRKTMFVTDTAHSEAVLKAKIPVPYGVAIALGSLIIFVKYADTLSAFIEF